MATMGAAFKTVEQRMRFTTRGMDKTTSEADWTLALERESVVSEYEAEAIGQASMRWPLTLRHVSHRLCATAHKSAGPTLRIEPQ